MGCKGGPDPWPHAARDHLRRVTEISHRPIAYWDSACPVCAREVAWLRPRHGGERLAWVDLASCDEAALGDLDRDRALARMHVRLPDGRLVAGAAAFAVIWGSMGGWLGRLGRLIGHPLLRPVADLAYAGFLAVRRLWRRPRPASA